MGKGATELDVDVKCSECQCGIAPISYKAANTADNGVFSQDDIVMWEVHSINASHV